MCAYVWYGRLLTKGAFFNLKPSAAVFLSLCYYSSSTPPSFHHMHIPMHCYSLLQVEELDRVKVELERERKYTAELLEQVSVCDL